MVLVKRQQPTSMRRQSSYPGVQQRTIGTRRESLVSCAMGDDDNNSLSSISSRQSSFASLGSHRNERQSSVLPSTLGISGSHHRHVKTPKWVLFVMCAMTAFSWIRAVQFRSTSFEILSAMDAELEGLEVQIGQSRRLLQDATDTKNSFSKQQWKLKKTQRNFKHETRMLEEMAELDNGDDDVKIPEATLKKFRNRRTGDVAKKWIEHRQEALLHKIFSLQAYIQEDSRNRIREKYGYGPYTVEFDVKSREGRKPGKFSVRLAPLDTVPHTVEAFLDMVTNKVWDNTVFYYHHTQSHVIAAAPVVYGTFQSKEHNLKSLGYDGVSFPEYSPEFPHKQHTVAFSGTGPNFYINALDNREHHGPGNQGHYDLDSDADPCFGEVVSGFDVLRDMQYARHKGNVAKGWEDYDLTRIISATLVGFQR